MPRAPILKSNPFILLPLFFKEYLNHQVRVNKMVNEHRVNYYFSPSVLTSRIHPLIYIQNFCWILCQTCFSHHGWGIFSNFWCSDYGKMYFASQKIKNSYFNSCSLYETLFRFFIISPRQREITHSHLRSNVLLKVYPSAEKGEKWKENGRKMWRFRKINDTFRK